MLKNCNMHYHSKLFVGNMLQTLILLQRRLGLIFLTLLALLPTHLFTTLPLLLLVAVLSLLGV